MESQSEIADALQGDALAGIDVPEQLQPSLERHRHNLARLILSLRSAGLSEEQIDQSVSAVVASYKEELLLAIKSIFADDPGSGEVTGV